jgi:hypothetical protein
MRHFFQKPLAIGILARSMGDCARAGQLVLRASTAQNLFSGQILAFTKAVPVAADTSTVNAHHDSTTSTSELPVTVPLQRVAAQDWTSRRKSRTLNVSSGLRRQGGLGAYSQGCHLAWVKNYTLRTPMMTASRSRTIGGNNLACHLPVLPILAQIYNTINTVLPNTAKSLTGFWRCGVSLKSSPAGYQAVIGGSRTASSWLLNSAGRSVSPFLVSAYSTAATR